MFSIELLFIATLMWVCGLVIGLAWGTGAPLLAAQCTQCGKSVRVYKIDHRNHGPDI
jgi:hypothetical protein